MVVLGVPAELEPLLGVPGKIRVDRKLSAVACVEFALVFATRKTDLDRWATAIIAKAPGDPILWFAYPKATSQRYACDFNRDLGWDVLRGAGYAPVRQVAIDQDWTALGFRRAEHIKNSTRRNPSSA